MVFIWPFFLVVLLAGALGCSVGFKKFIWFMSVGYGLAISLIGAAMLVMSIIYKQISIPYLLLCAVVIIYGLRLGLFLLVRELKNADYRKTLASAGGEKKMPAPVLVSMWLMNTCLYYMETAGLHYRLANTVQYGTAIDQGNVCLWIGLVIAALGVIIEAVSDAQKSAQKKENPNMVATKGLFKMCRCPNYFGEILVWTGILVSALPVLHAGQWVIAILGYVCIVYIMFNGAKRLETRQTKRCWKMQEYRDYANKTPIIIPFLPIYHLINWIQD